MAEISTLRRAASGKWYSPRLSIYQVRCRSWVEAVSKRERVKDAQNCFPNCLLPPEAASATGSRSAKSRWKFYAQVRGRSSHSLGHFQTLMRAQGPLCPLRTDIVSSTHHVQKSVNFGSHRCYSITSSATACRATRQQAAEGELRTILGSGGGKIKTASPSRWSYCRRTGRLSGPRKPNPCQRTLAGAGKVMLGKRSNSMGSRMAPTVRRDRCAPAQ